MTARWVPYLSDADSAVHLVVLYTPSVMVVAVRSNAAVVASVTVKQD